MPIAPAKWPIPITAAILLLLLPSIKDGRPWGFSAGAQSPAQTAQSADRLQIERIGGLAGAGAADSRFESRGEVALSQLSPADRQAIEELFKNHKGEPPSGSGDVPSYRLTRQTAAGPETITVPFNAVPEVIHRSVKDTLK